MARALIQLISLLWHGLQVTCWHRRRSVPVCLIQTSSSLHSTSAVSSCGSETWAEKNWSFLRLATIFFLLWVLPTAQLWKQKMKEKLPDTKLPYKKKKKNSEMPGLILIFQCEIHIFITFIPFLWDQGYLLSSYFSLSLVEGLAAPSRALCCTDSIKYWVFRGHRFCLSHHLVSIMYIFGL